MKDVLVLQQRRLSYKYYADLRFSARFKYRATVRRVRIVGRVGGNWTVTEVYIFPFSDALLEILIVATLQGILVYIDWILVHFANESHGNPIQRLGLKITPKKSERQARSTVTGLMSQFSQLHCRRSILDRLTDAVGNLFGRMCIRRRRHRGLEQSPPADGDNTETLGAEAACRKEAKTVKSFTGAKKDYSAIPLVDEDFLQQLEDDLCGGEVYEEPTPRHYRSFSEMGPRIELRIGEGVEKLEVEGNKRYHEMSGDHFCH
ncbi:hypothetical protein EGW08_015057 [Elysia chlorotica]|uniref:Uncharacterized protein n=1 Tax=Elysia chlorotica TaxID=188477 RepID=A0A3S1B6F6_ELYCH|nr:hypothetical protein EGW08_015057 [Elysia chlorotica]